MTGSRVAILSSVLPPAASGQAVILAKLLEGVPQAAVRLVALRKSSVPTDAAFETYGLLDDMRESRGRARRTGSVVFAIPRLARLLRRQRCRALVVCTGNLGDVAVGWAAARLSRTRLYLYVFDDLVEQWPTAGRRRIAAALERLVARSLAGTIAPNEFLAAQLRARRGIEATVVRNGCDLSSYPAQPNDEPTERKIVYTGSVYGPQLCGLRQLAAAIATIEPPIWLHVYTSQSAGEVAAAGVAGPRVVIHEPLPREAVPLVQQAAWALFLPLAADGRYTDALIRTSAPAKLAEYLAAGTPLLVQAMRDTYVGDYVTGNRAGLVVDLDDPGALTDALKQLDDPELRTRLRNSARNCARRDFDIRDGRRTFARFLGLPSVS